MRPRALYFAPGRVPILQTSAPALIRSDGIADDRQVGAHLGTYRLYHDRLQNDPPFREHLAFDSQNEAVDFAMSLDNPQRRTVQLHLPSGDIAELPVIERMRATQK